MPAVPERDVPRRRRLCLLIDRAAPRRWHSDLLDALAALPGISTCVILVDGENRLPESAGLLFRLEQIVYRTAEPTGIAAVTALAITDHPPATVAPGDGDIVIDLSGDLSGAAIPPGTEGPIWRLTYDGGAGEVSLLSAILAGWAPLAEIRDGDRLVAAGRLGTEYQGIAGLAFEDALRRTITLICRAVLGETQARPLAAPMPDASGPAPQPIDGGRIGRIAAKTVARAIVRQLYHLCVHSPQWRVGWRKMEDHDVFDDQRLPETGWRDLPDDGLRFYADPFPIERDGRIFLFVEDYAHRLGKGIVSAVEFGPDGPIGRPEPVLETPFHLSYPFVFEAEGEAWMIPESCVGGTVDLFRATRFPGGWVKEATLLSGITASDATLIERDGRWWMFATVRDRGGAFSDALHLWSAPSFRGPFAPHAANPVLIDSASARPAGRIVERGGALLRPVQDCRRTYGGALGLARIDRLDDEAYGQTVTTVLRPGASWAGHRLHTLNRAGAFAFVDGSARPPRRF